MRTCCKCKESKSEEHFPWRNKSKGIKQSYCKECKKLYNKNWYNNQENRTNQIARATKNSRAFRDKFLQWKMDYILKKGGCSYEDCDVVHPALIDFDHKDGVDKRFNISQALRHYASLEEIEKEADKCVLLCANHHRLRTFEQFGWYSGFEIEPL